MTKTVSAESGKMLRRLGTFEEYAWLLEQRVSRTVVVAAELEGATTIAGWRSALNAVQARHTILCSRICKTPGYRPHFEFAPGVELPLRVISSDARTSVLEYCSRELGTMFAQGDMLTRATILHSKDRSTLLLAAAHAALDGRSITFILRDLLSALAGEPLGDRRAISPSHDDLLGLSTSDKYSVPSAEMSGPPPGIRVADEGVHSLEQVWLEPSITSAITHRARQEQTTVHGALTAAILLAGRKQSQLWTGAPIRCASPIDNRAMLGVGEEPGVLLTIAYTELNPANSPSFWDLARGVKRDVTVHQTIADAARGIAPIREIIAAGIDPDRAVTMNRQRAHALMVTNYGRLAIPEKYGPLRLKSISSFVASGAPRTQTVSVATLNGLLCMTNVSVDLIPSLLEETKKLLIAQLI